MEKTCLWSFQVKPGLKIDLITTIIHIHSHAATWYAFSCLGSGVGPVFSGIVTDALGFKAATSVIYCVVVGWLSIVCLELIYSICIKQSKLNIHEKRPLLAKSNAQGTY